MKSAPERNLGLELVRATEAAALAAARWVGRGQKEFGDQAAVDAFRLLLGTVNMAGVVVIGEGEKDHAPMLFNGEQVGTGRGSCMDIAVDPVEGTNLLARGEPNSIAIVGASPCGTMWQPGSAFYMDKIVVGPEAAGKIDLDAPVAVNLHAVARSKGINIEEVTVVILDRPRNAEKIAAARAAGARVRLITDGDVAPSLMCALPDTGIDVVMGLAAHRRGSSLPAPCTGWGAKFRDGWPPSRARSGKKF